MGRPHPRLLLLSNVLFGACIAISLIYAGLAFVAFALVNRAPTKPVAGQPHIVWSNHGFLHYVPPSDYAFSEAVMSYAPVVAGVTFATFFFKWWLARSRL
jgi:hypothetical protein